MSGDIHDRGCEFEPENCERMSTVTQGEPPISGALTSCRAGASKRIMVGH